MNRLTVLADISSRAMKSTVGSPKTVAAAVAVDTGILGDLRNEVRNFPKWGSSQDGDVEHMIDLLCSQAVAVAVVSFNRETEAWAEFLKDAEILHKAIILQSRKVAGWAKAPNLLKFLLLSSACAAATGHALGIDRRPKIVSHMNRQLVSCQTICDQEVEGEENLEVFKGFWGEQHIPKAKLARFGIDMTTESVEVTTDLLEPALLMADYAAGLGLAYVSDQVGTLRLPLSQDRSKEHLLKLSRRSKLVMQEEEFDFSYKEIFSEVMDHARELADG